MPRKNKKASKAFTGSNTSFRHASHPADGEVFRNFFAVSDDVDPRVSLQYMKEMFSGKVEEDVITMVFSECAYDVDQTLESLFALSNDKHSSCSDFPQSTKDDISKASAKSERHLKRNRDPVNVPCPQWMPPKPLINSSYVSTPPSQRYFAKETNNQQQTSSCNDFLHDSTDGTCLGSSDHNDISKYQSFNEPVEKQELSTEGRVEEYFSSSHLGPQHSPMATPETFTSSETKQLPFYSNFAHVQQPFHSFSPFSGTPLLNQRVSPHFITPLVPIRSKMTVSDETLFSKCTPPNSHKNWFTVSAAKKSNFAPSNVNDISSKIIDGHPVMVLLRGLPGSGKSTLAKELKFSGVALSTDDYFSKNGRYRFDGRKLAEAHEWNRKRTLNALEMGITPIIIDNTNTEPWEMLPYVKIAVNFQYEIYILEPNTPWKFKANKLAKRNSHNVPQVKIERMLERYDHTVTVESLKSMLKKSSNNSSGSPPSSQRQSEERDKPGSDGKGDTQNETSTINKLQSVSNESFAEASSHSQPSQCISLEAIVHQEQEAKSYKDLNDESLEKKRADQISRGGKGNDTQDSIKCTGESSSVQEWSKIDDINKLKLLVREESEESQSFKAQLSSDSSQEVTGWEAITERDEDFSWSGSSFVNQAAVEKNATSSHDVNIPTNNDNLSECHKIFDLCEESVENDKTFRRDRSVSLSSQMLSSTNSDPETSSVNSPTESITCENIFTQSHNMPKELDAVNDWSGFESSSTELSWNNTIPETTSIKTLEMSSFAPKPQGQFHQKKILDGYGKSDSISNEIRHSDLEIPKSDDSKKIFAFESTSDWAIPNFEPEDSTKLWDDNDVKDIHQATLGTQTEPGDFVLCHKLETNELFVTILKTLTPSLIHNKEVVSKGVNEIENLGIPRVIPLDKSTSTSDIPVDIENCEKIKILQSCFPEILEDDLCHLLDICHGDSSWLSTILLDWGYKYNMPELMTTGQESSTCNSLPLGLHGPSAIGDSGSSSDIADQQSSKETPISIHSNSMSLCSSDDQSHITVEKPIESEDKEIENATPSSSPLLKLILDPDLASCLQQCFGPVDENHSGVLPEHLRTLTLDLSLAQLLFNKWKETINSSHSTEGKFGNQYSSSSASTDNQFLAKESSKETCSSSLLGTSFIPSGEPKSLAEIMDMEYAIQLSRKEKLKRENKHGLAAKLRRMELHRMFPGVDTLALDDVFDANNCSLEKTLKALEADIGIPAKLDPPSATVSLSQEKSKILEDFNSGNWTEWVHEDGFLNEEKASSVESPPEAEHWRAEAAKHYQIQQECTSKAQSAFYRGMRDVASFYSQTGNYHRYKFKAANKKASEIIIQNKNECLDALVLDLHGLYIQEAIPLLRKFLKHNFDKCNGQFSADQSTVTVITGRGSHSIRGARLRPSVIKFLNSSGYRFDEINIGVFNICLSPFPQT